MAVDAHRGQMDADGLPHIVHSMGVMQRVLEMRLTVSVAGYSLEDMMSAAILHDVVEDTLITLDGIRERFGDKVAGIVDSVTRRTINGVKESYRDFIYRAKAHTAGRIIKNADLQHNLNRTHSIKKASWRDKLVYKYGIALRVLNDEWEPTWEDASYEYSNGKHFVSDPDGKRIEISAEEAKNVKISNLRRSCGGWQKLD